MISETRKGLNLVERTVSEEKVPWTVQMSHRAVRKRINGDFISAMYADTDKGTKWVSIQKNGCPDAIKVKSNQIKVREDIPYDIVSIEKLFVRSIKKQYWVGNIQRYEFYKFID